MSVAMGDIQSQHDEYETDVAPFYTGEALRKAVHEEAPTTDFLIRNFIPTRSLIQIYAPDGIGKSVVVLQALIQAAAGLPVFGGLEVKRPLRIAVYLTERPAAEAFTRMKCMEMMFPFTYENILIDESLQGYDITRKDDQDKFLNRIMQTCAMSFHDKGGVDIIFIDPIYAVLPVGLKGDDAAGHVNMLLRRIKLYMKCALIYTHHANRGKKNEETGKREHEDMYGNRFISANVTGVFKMQQTPTGTILRREKDSWACLAPVINLTYDHETYLSALDEGSSTANLLQKMESFLTTYFRLKKDFYYDHFKAENGVSDSHAREFLSGHLKNGRIINCNPIGKKALYKIIREF